MLPQPDHRADYIPVRRDPAPFSEAELEWQFRRRNSLESARRSATKAALIGAITVVALCVVAIVKSEIDRGFVFDQLPVLIICWLGWIVGFTALYIRLTGLISGWIAHRFAFETAVPVSRLAIAIAWVANLSLWGWALVVVMGGL